MNADCLYVSESAAAKAAADAIAKKRTDAFRVVPRLVRNPDRSVDHGYAAIITLRGKAVGFA